MGHLQKPQSALLTWGTVAIPMLRGCTSTTEATSSGLSQLKEEANNLADPARWDSAFYHSNALS